MSTLGKYFTFETEAGNESESGVARDGASPVKKGSIAFHRNMGFEIKTGDASEDGILIHPNYDGDGNPQVVFVREILSLGNG